MWGLIAGLILAKSWIGWMVFSIGGWFVWLSIFEFTVKPIHQFWSSFHTIKNSQSLIDQLWNHSIQNRIDQKSQPQFDSDATNPQISWLFSNSDRSHPSFDDFNSSTSRSDQKIDKVLLSSMFPSVSYLKQRRVDFVSRPHFYLSKQSHLTLNNLPIDYSLADISTRMRLYYSYLSAVDRHINQIQLDQLTILQTFQLLVIMAAENSRKQNRTRIEDFVRTLQSQVNYQQSDNKMTDLLELNPTQLRLWFESHLHQVNEARSRYIDQQVNFLIANARASEEEQKASEQRKRLMLSNSKTCSALNKNEFVMDERGILKSKTDNYRVRQSASQVDISKLNVIGNDKEEVVASALDICKQIEQLYQNRESDLPPYFIDADFPVESDINQLVSEGSNGKQHSSTVWKRPQEFIPNPVLFSQLDSHSEMQDKTDWLSKSCYNIVQGAVEDCYFLSAVTSIMNVRPKLFDAMLITKQYSPIGLYCACFYISGQWKAVFVDDQLPVIKSTNELVFAKSRQSDELWISLLEKCYAKLYAGYRSIIGGLVHDALQDCTGGVSEEINLNQNSEKKNRIWYKLLQYKNEGHLMGCG